MAVGLTTGGALARLCAQEGVPLFQYQWPGPPRTAIGYGLFPLLAWLQRLGLGSDRTKAVESAIGEMELLSWELRVQTPEARNRAKQLARHIGQRAVVIYGAEYLAAVAHRWKSQINENAKSWAFYDALPEAGHNSIEGLRLPALARDAMYAIVLRAASYHPRIARRCDLFTEALARVGVVHEVVEAPGSTPLAQVMTSVLLGDYTSYYLGILRGVDPAATPALDLLKEQMAQG
jgi:glucose/mannose-6-phosphate isomerase